MLEQTCDARDVMLTLNIVQQCQRHTTLSVGRTIFTVCKAVNDVNLIQILILVLSNLNTAGDV